MAGAVGLNFVKLTSRHCGDYGGTCEPSYVHYHYLDRNKGFCFLEDLITRTPDSIFVQGVKERIRGLFYRY